MSNNVCMHDHKQHLDRTDGVNGESMSVERPYDPIPEAAKYWGFAETTLYTWRSLGRLPKTCIGGKAVIFRRDMEALIHIREPRPERRAQ
jgi:hypothetical protein